MRGGAEVAQGVPQGVERGQPGVAQLADARLFEPRRRRLPHAGGGRARAAPAGAGVSGGAGSDGTRDSKHKVDGGMTTTTEERHEAALQRILDWANAYPIDVFPEPCWERAHEVLKSHGMSLAAISAHNMRHVIEGVGKIAKEALQR